ncbi:hemin uptake protein HemP [Budviciaceae bacterium BWR-B9]|uniref:Hemin uptake protein HemP n=1 Tax=Limnobaculum allomyrinae TaxID=2791986 RepID=A0ABS1IPZ1_9GAMM|nr:MULTISPECIES: hemin uptake protein HemP [Limnobaculum]MBK5143834.1 hemin uptake protein HemP [Limnobaculum allomyrinae]MBV7693573.1 hemin uptake protein HemP [Limnobaculum sp. M2-1]
MKTLSSQERPEIKQPADPASPLPLVSSQQLLGESGILLIQHQGQQYQLRITKTGKLILTK